MSWWHHIIERVAKKMRSNVLVKRVVYDPLKVFFRRRLCSFEYMLYYMKANRECGEESPQRFDAPGGTRVLGILRDPFYGHEPYLVACKELGVGYRVVDIFASNWIEQVKASGCDMFLAWPGESIQEWKRLYDDRLRFLVEQMGKKVFPDLTATWLYGSKERQHLWMELNAIPHPKTWVFYSDKEALEFVEKHAEFPVVAKTDIGAVSSGVQILRTKEAAIEYIKVAFNRGITGYYSDKQANQWRHVLFQEYFVDVKEWRVHRQGDSFFGFGKAKKSDFHSGSGETIWEVPPKAALDLAWDITEKNGFRSMAVDIFETPDGRFIVNELQCVYGQHCDAQLKKNGETGRLLHLPSGDWKFEPGIFSTNHGCNLRVAAALQML